LSDAGENVALDHGKVTAMSTHRIRVMCVDDHTLVREGIALILRRQSDIQVVALASSGEEALELFRIHRPEITLMDLQLGAMSGVQTTRAIRREFPDSRIIVLTMYRGDEDVHRALEAGAATYLLKDTLSDDLIRVLREVHAGTHHLQPGIAALLAQRAAGQALTPRETQIVGLVGQGMRNKEIAAALSISEDTVGVHLKNIFSKLSVRDRSAAITVALRRGIIHVP
jgi:DNA-binding NarL/FixJ family response regulator